MRLRLLRAAPKLGWPFYFWAKLFDSSGIPLDKIDGKAALHVMAKEEPTKFVQACASLMPKEVSMEIGSPLSGMSDQELTDALDAVRRLKAEMAQPVIEIKKLA